MKKVTNKLHFSLAIPADEYQHYYRGTGRYVITRSRDGLTVQFPAGWLTRFLSHDGIFGDFIISYDENHKLVSIERLEGR